MTDDGEEVTGNTELVVPYFGFNSSWDDAPIFDRFAWDPNTFYGRTLLVDPAGNILNGNSHSTGYQPERFAFFSERGRRTGCRHSGVLTAPERQAIGSEHLE
nr:hypothetical protein [Planococcus glaciei]